MAAVPHSRARNLRDEGEMDIMMNGLSKLARQSDSGASELLSEASCAPLLIGAMNAAQHGRSRFTAIVVLR
ncbi:hypothetical protein [Sphingopyxis macrogoltabida]|uniref:hypothetical protein n=1 Tax=Sphingopyxis macrogoltabida TaxID=33050 RepID=UPI001395E852|nr:hypothetical protein [Sphingopyxis macrogoltabida]